MLLRHIVNNKMGIAVPLYRQEQLFKLGDDIGISKQTMSSWRMKTGRELLKHLYKALQNEINKYPLVNMDKTPIKVIELYNKKCQKKTIDSKTNNS